MPRVSAERLFKSFFPKARVRRCKPTYEPAYFLVYENGGQPGEMYSGCGTTPAQAWTKACEGHNITTLKEVKTP